MWLMLMPTKKVPMPLYIHHRKNCKVYQKDWLKLCSLLCNTQYLLYLSRYCVYKVPENNENFYVVIIYNDVWVRSAWNVYFCGNLSIMYNL